MRIDHRVKVTYEVTVTLGEAEARAIKVLSDFGADNVLRILEPMTREFAPGRDRGEGRGQHANGLTAFLSLVREQLGPQLDHIDKVREIARHVP